ncbi:MAG: tetraacyldisaccharide 4'-kinase, partial [Acidobacteria bacterium]|nr:tetraacyldisaccharide 4'-kinase [Acidobacteriota bacterium]
MKRTKRLQSRLIYFLYRTVQAFGLPLLLFYFLLRGLRDARYLRSMRQRFGFLPRTFRQTSPGAIWLHAVSVGEVLALPELVRRLGAEFPRAPLFISTSTLAGKATAESRLGGSCAGVFYAPVDYVFAVRRVLRTIRPSVVVVAETEIWPNLFREVKRTGAGLLMVNGRISDRAVARYVKWRGFFQHVLRWPDAILAQSAELRERFLQAGAPPASVRVGGNLKYDFQPHEAGPDSPVRRYLERVRPGKLWMAASTMPPAGPGDLDEDDAVIEAYQSLAARHADLLLILVPRKPERFDLVDRKLRAAGVPFVRRSALASASGEALPHVLLLDSIGELGGLFFLADVVFMGGTLARRGGHNILEPAFFGRPIVAGPHMENFQAIAGQFRGAGAMVEIESASALASAVHLLFVEPDRASELGRRALVCAESRRGATGTAAAEIRRLYTGCFPSFRPLFFLLLWPLARIWGWGGRWKRARDLARRKRLRAAVVSIGNLTMGGTGKTPMVLYVAEKLKAAGRKPGILTRGYGRHSPEKHLVLDAGALVPALRSGDEPQIFLRAAVAPVGIGPNRFHNGQLLERQFHVDTLVLDDGFQHLRLARQVDVVLVDGLNPFGGGELFPLGRLREPMSGLARAGIFVITRSDSGRTVETVEAMLRRHNPRAPIFQARAVPECWIEYQTGSP